MDPQHPRILLGDGTFTDRGGQTCTRQEQLEICCTEGGAENDGHENNGPSKCPARYEIDDMKMTDMKLTDIKLTDMKLTDMKM